MKVKNFSIKGQTIITPSTVSATPSTPVTTSGTIPPVVPAPITTKITRAQCELLLPKVAKMYQDFYLSKCILATVSVIPFSERNLHNNANISISFPMSDIGDVIFYHKAFFSTPNTNGNTWNAESDTTYGTHDSVSIHVVDGPQSLQLIFQYLMTSEDLQAYFPNASTNGRVYFEFMALNPYSDSNRFNSHIDDFSVLFNHYLHFYEASEDFTNAAIAYHTNSLAKQAHII